MGSRLADNALLVIGHNPPCPVTFAIFVIPCTQIALVNNFLGLQVLRFLRNCFGSPGFATGGTRMGDMYLLLKIPYLLAS